MKAYYVYSLKCADDSTYTSITCQLAKRLQEHHHGKRIRTRYRRPLTLISCTKFSSISDAIHSEISLKTRLQVA